MKLMSVIDNYSDNCEKFLFDFYPLVLHRARTDSRTYYFVQLIAIVGDHLKYGKCALLMLFL